MSLFNPIFAFVGLGLISIPIIIHFLNRRRFKIVDWAAMQYLLAALRKNRRRLQLESLLLLLTRCAALALLGLALARPMGCGGNAAAAMAAQQVGLHVIILDDSYSMAYEADRPTARTHLGQAKRIIHDLAQRLGRGSQQVAVITASRPARVLVRPTYDMKAITDAVDALPQSTSDTDIPESLRLAQQLAKESQNLPSKTLYLLSDCTNSALRGPGSEQLATLGPEVAKQYHVIVHDLSLADQSNCAITSLMPSEPFVRIGFASDLIGRAYGYGQVAPALIEWQVGNQKSSLTSGLRLDAQSPPVIQSGASFDHRGPVVVRATVKGYDKLPIDDQRLRVVDVAGDVHVLIVEGRSGNQHPLDGSGGFLRMALAPPIDTSGPNRAGQYIIPTLVSDQDLRRTDLSEYRAIALAGVGAINDDDAKALRAYVAQGGALLIFMGDRVNAEIYNHQLGPLGLLPGVLTARIDAPAGEQGFLLNFNANHPHPMLNVFKDQEKTGLESARFFSYWGVQLDPKLAVQHVLDFRGPNDKTAGDPAITLHNLGLGHVVFFASSADAEWSTLVARQSAYVTLMHELVAGGIGASDDWMTLSVGDRIVLPPTMTTDKAPQVVAPDKSRSVLQNLPPTPGQAARWMSEPLFKTGEYTVVVGGKDYPVVVNPPDDEADIRPVGAAGIKSALGDIELDMHRDTLDPETLTQHDSADFAWPLLFALLPLLFMESFMAWKFGRSRS